MSDALTSLEKQLAGLQPQSSVDQDRLIFEAGQASAAASPIARQSGAQLGWKWCAIAASLAAVFLLAAFATTFQALNRARQREIVLLESLESDPSQMLTGGEPKKSVAQNAAPKNESIVVYADNSQFMLRRQALESGVLAPRQRKSKRTTKAISFGDTRRVLAMIGENQGGLRRIETLRQQ